MAFKKLKQITDSREESMEEKEEETLKNEDDTSTETGQSEKNDNDFSKDSREEEENGDEGQGEETQPEQPQESIEELKARLAQTERDRDNYRNATLAAKAKTRSLREVHKLPEKDDVIDEEVEVSPTEISPSKKMIYETLYELNERKVLQNVINPKHTDYISELVDDSQYNEILGYLPRKIDQTSQDGILRALRLAVNSWKLDKGIVGDTDVKKTKQKTSADAKVADLAAINSSVSHSKNDSVKKRKKHILKRNIPVSEWYK